MSQAIQPQASKDNQLGLLHSILLTPVNLGEPGVALWMTSVVILRST